MPKTKVQVTKVCASESVATVPEEDTNKKRSREEVNDADGPAKPKVRLISVDHVTYVAKLLVNGSLQERPLLPSCRMCCMPWQRSLPASSNASRVSSESAQSSWMLGLN